MTDAMLTRTLECTRHGTDAVQIIAVSVSSPERDPLPGGDYRVRVEIAGLDAPYSQYFHGVDPIQAMLMGLWIVPDVVRSLAGHSARVTWRGDEELGFRYGQRLTRENDESATE